MLSYVKNSFLYFALPLIVAAAISHFSFTGQLNAMGTTILEASKVDKTRPPSDYTPALRNIMTAVKGLNSHPIDFILEQRKLYPHGLWIPYKGDTSLKVLPGQPFYAAYFNRMLMGIVQFSLMIWVALYFCKLANDRGVFDFKTDENNEPPPLRPATANIHNETAIFVAPSAQKPVRRERESTTGHNDGGDSGYYERSASSFVKDKDGDNGVSYREGDNFPSSGDNGSFEAGWKD